MKSYTVLVTVAVSVERESPEAAENAVHEMMHQALMLSENEACPIVQIVALEGKLHVSSSWHR